MLCRLRISGFVRLSAELTDSKNCPNPENSPSLPKNGIRIAPLRAGISGEVSTAQRRYELNVDAGSRQWQWRQWPCRLKNDHPERRDDHRGRSRSAVRWRCVCIHVASVSHVAAAVDFGV